ncbi:TraY domain-containing protein [Rahnella contaminans]|uniref:TraY domain-containing protein n=1 Tax=Rahnella contaminans TaxID=2703882 RepID=UPI003C2EC61F
MKKKEVRLIVELPMFYDKFLSESSERSFRTKAKEASIRLQDHLNNSLNSIVPDIKKAGGMVTLTVGIPIDFNKKLSICAIINAREKSKEASLRIQDHLSRFSGIASIGRRIN